MPQRGASKTPARIADERARAAALVLQVVTNLEVDGKLVMCRCWKSATFPNCDGSHVKHNEATGDNVGPLIVAAKK